MERTQLFEEIGKLANPNAMARLVKAEETAWAKVMGPGGPGESQRNHAPENDEEREWQEEKGSSWACSCWPQKSSLSMWIQALQPQCTHSTNTNVVIVKVIG